MRFSQNCFRERNLWIRWTLNIEAEVQGMEVYSFEFWNYNFGRVKLGENIEAYANHINL